MKKEKEETEEERDRQKGREVDKGKILKGRNDHGKKKREEKRALEHKEGQERGLDKQEEGQTL
jgi:hypothetical protein